MRLALFAAAFFAFMSLRAYAGEGHAPASQPATRPANEGFQDSTAQKVWEQYQAKMDALHGSYQSQKAGILFQEPAIKTTESLRARLDALDAIYRKGKAQVLREYADGLELAKWHALNQAGVKEAQEIYDKAEDIFRQADQLDPPAKPAANENLTPFHIRLRDFDGAGGTTGVVEINETSVRFIAEDDFGHPPREIWKRELRPAERKAMSAYMRTFPLDSLRDGYVDPSVLDGYDMDYIIQIGAGKERHIHVSNMRQFNLEALVAHVNEVLPPKCQIGGWGHSSFHGG